MRSLKLSVMGIIIGTIIGAFSVVIAYASLALEGERLNLPLAILVLALGGSMLIGGFCVALRCLVSGRERSLVSILIALAVASLIVYSGNFAYGSHVPLLIYAAAVVNGLLIARAVGPLCAISVASNSRFLSE